MPHSIVDDGLKRIEIKSYRSWSHSGALSRSASDSPDLQSHALGALTGQKRLSSSSFPRSRPGLWVAGPRVHADQNRVGDFYRTSYYFQAVPARVTPKSSTASYLSEPLFVFAQRQDSCTRSLLVDERRPCCRQSSRYDLQDHICRDLRLRFASFTMV